MVADYKGRLFILLINKNHPVRVVFLLKGTAANDPKQAGRVIHYFYSF